MAQTLAPPGGRLARLRQTLRNPSVPVVVAIVVVALAIPAGIFGPAVFRTGAEGLREQKRLHERQFAQPIAGSWINPWLREKAARMIAATTPIEWRGVSFQSGPCYSENLSQLPKDKWSQAIIEGCRRMDDIQQRYAVHCAATDACLVPAEARQELQAVADFLVAEYTDAGFVEPYSTQEQSSR